VSPLKRTINDDDDETITQQTTTILTSSTTTIRSTVPYGVVEVRNRMPYRRTKREKGERERERDDSTAHTMMIMMTMMIMIRKKKKRKEIFRINSSLHIPNHGRAPSTDYVSFLLSGN